MALVPTSKQGWLIVATVVLLVLVGLGGMFYQQRRSLVAMGMEQPLEVPIYQPTEEEARAVDRKLTELAEAIRQGEARTVAFTADQLNTLVATRPELAPARGRVVVRLKRNEVEVEGSVKFALLEVPFMGERYLAGTVTVRPEIVKDKLRLTVLSMQPRQGKMLPEIQTLMERRDWLARLRLAREPARRRAFQQFEAALAELAVRDGLLLVRTRDRQVVPPEAGGMTPTTP